MALASPLPLSPAGEDLSESYRQSLSTFKQFDVNGDGVISREELGDIFRAIDPDHWTDDRLQKLMDVADTNRDGNINYEEFIKWLMGGEDPPEWDTDRVALKLARRASIQRKMLTVDRRAAAVQTEPLRFQVDQSFGEKLGVKVDGTDGRALLIKSITAGGLIHEWNREKRMRQVNPGDRIVEVNDLRGDAQRLMKELKKKLPMDLVIMPSETHLAYVTKIFDAYDVEPVWLEEGTFSCIKRATHEDTKAAFAVKSVHKKRTPQEQFENMISILKELDHPNIIKLFEVFEDCLDYHLVVELCEGGELFERVLRDKFFTERQAASITLQILAGVGYLHSRQICHRNLRPEHVLLEADKNIDNSVVKIVDFRSARKFGGGQLFEDPVGEVVYMPPEMARGSPYDHTCDLWSCGVMLYLVIAGYPPFVGEDEGETLRLVQRADLIFCEGDWRNVSEAARELVGSLLSARPRGRPSAAEAAGHQWIKNCELEGQPFSLKKGQEKMKAYCGQSKLKKAALHEVARRLKTDEIQQLYDMFALLDKNGDKLVTFYELKEGLDNLGRQELLEDLKKVMEEVDLDGNRRIDYTEFLASTLDRKCYREEQALWAAFQVFDRDRSGTISKSELGAVLGCEELQGVVNAAEVERVLAECDTDNNGTIDFQEFMALMDREGLPLDEDL